jgi:orotidine-5'-phosphate decarboxylase
VEAAQVSVRKLGDAVGFYKIGLELFMVDGYFGLVDWLIDR